MSWINRFSSALFSRDIFIMLNITVLLFLIVNFVFVYFSPSIIPLLPSDFVRSVSGCYRTLFHFGDAQLDGNTKYEIVHGDSYSEGSGDEFLNGDRNYGIFRKLTSDTERSFMVFGRGGFGNLRTVIEESRCAPLLTKYTSFEYKDTQVERVTLVFYEGNDLYNNLRELGYSSSGIKHKLRFFLPLFDYTLKKIDGVRKQVKRWMTDETTTELNEAQSDLPFPISDSGIKIAGYPPSAPVELTDVELETSLNVLSQSLTSIQMDNPEQRLQLLYLPFSGALPVKSYNGGKYFLTNGNINRERSGEIRARIQTIASSIGWEFCDVTEDILATSSTGVALHGPRDWGHFNKDGYTIVKNAYLKCFQDE